MSTRHAREGARWIWEMSLMMTTEMTEMIVIGTGMDSIERKTFARALYASGM